MTMLPFSAGPRKCIGEFFARIEMQIHLMIIAKHLRLRCVSGQQVQLEAGVNLRDNIRLYTDSRDQAFSLSSYQLGRLGVFLGHNLVYADLL
jgi:Cytochrome P450